MNFSDKTFENIKYMLQHSDKEILLNDENLGQYYLDLLKARHNVLHFSVLQMFGMPWKEEKTVRSFLNLNDTNKILDKTPDIQIFHQGVLYLIDVSISYDYKTNGMRKQEKYDLVVQYLKTLDIKSEFIHVNCNISRSNLFKELEKVSFLKKYPFDIQNFGSCQDIIQLKFDLIKENISHEYFENLKLKEFSDSIEIMGYVEDIDINLNEFLNFNSRFEIEKNILESYEEQVDEEELCNILEEILETKDEIFEKYKDKKCNGGEFEVAHMKIKELNDSMEKDYAKPSHHIVFPFYEDFKISSSVIEQTQILDFFKFLNKRDHRKHIDIGMGTFVLELGDEIIKMFDNNNPNKEYNESVFYDYFKTSNENILGIYKKMIKFKTLLTVPWEKLDQATKKYFRLEKDNYEEVLKLSKVEYEILKEKFVFNEGNYSYKDFLSDNDVIKNEKKWFSTYAFKNKCFITELESKTDVFKKIYHKTGISHKFKREELEKKYETTINIENDIHVENFLEELCEVSRDDNSIRYQDMIKEMSDFDDDYSKYLKSELNDIVSSKFDYLRRWKSFEYLKKIKLISTQLMHFTMLEMKPGSFSVFTCGIPNFICIVAGCYNKLFSQLGKPFMCCFITRNPQKYTEFFGKLFKYKINDEDYIVFTNWRRLPSFKLLHLKDLFYSIISSTFNSLVSYANEFSPLEDHRIVKTFSLRTLIGCATNQKPSEFLVDVRYAYVSSYAKYTNIEKLLLEKFSPPYKTAIECWIVERLFKRLPEIHKNRKNIKLTSANYFGGRRTLDSMGVKFDMPSLWFDYNLIEINEFLDEAFVYVHTLKEPSNIYYENVKAINTIMKFQEQYDILPKHRQMGIYKTRNDLREFLISDNQIGCFSRCIIQSANLMYNKDNPNFKKIIHQIDDEDIGELISTKAVISDNDRKIKPVKEFTKRQILKRVLKNEYFEANMTNEEIATKYVIESKSPFYNNRKPRQKVFETTLNILEHNKNIQKTKNLADYFISVEKGKVNADICIKAQYGSKREFYVINIGAKALARCTENFFKKICEVNIHEAISIPGDHKMMEMQRMIDRAYNSEKMKPTSKLIYVNGDCTKWSAAETMSSFISLIIPLRDRIPEKMYNLLLATYNSWSDKNIQIPLDIINNFILPGDDQKSKKYNFIRDSILKNNGKFHSTQNFLQGMYNYASSYKAVCCSNYTFHIWKKIYPDSTLFIEHMEHSDDYVLVVMTETYKEFEKFRVLHKIMMKMHGFNDSDKKTNCQEFMMEFVSLISFNGVMLYPMIKKTKEVNTNLPCVGFRSDIEASYSRVGEAMRMGCNQSFLYFMEKWQNICVAEAYSLLPGMSNAYCDEYKEMLNTPIEMFGLIDMLPLFSLYCSGNGNNYRLYKYGNETIRNKIRYLMLKAKIEQINEEVLVENNDHMYSLFNPKFIYERSNNSIVKLRRKLKWSIEDLTKFWKENICYRFLKPRERGKLIKWLKSMFYNRTFTEAYSKSSRTKMTMRLSHFIRNPIISLKIDKTKFKEKYPEKISTLMTMREYIDYIENDIGDVSLEWSSFNEKELIRIVTKCDPTFGAIYEYLRNVKIVDRYPITKSNRPQISIKTPRKISSFDIVNNPSVIIQYIYNYEDFLKDKRRIVSEYSLLKDIEVVKENFIDENLRTEGETNVMELLSLYNNLKILSEKSIVCIGFSRHSETLKEQIGDVIKYNYLPYANCEINFSDFIRIVDPVTSKLLYTRGGKLTPNIIQQSLENITLLHSYMVLKQTLDREQCEDVLNKIIFKDPIDKNELQFHDILTMITEKNIKTFNLNTHTIKLLGYFKAYYLGDNSILNLIVSDNYGYSYKYEKMAQKIGDEWIGETAGYFKHLDRTIGFLNIDQKNKEIIILEENVDFKLLKLHYNIALRLTSNRSEKDFQLNPTKIGIPIKKLFNTNEEAQKFFDEKNVRGLYTRSDGKYKYVKYQEFDCEKEYLPVMKVGENYDIEQYRRGSLRPTYINIRNDILMVFLGKSKLFTLPVLACKQFSNMRYIGKNRLYSELISDNNLYNYFHQKQMNVYKKELFDLKQKTIMTQIEKKKLYDFYDDSIIEYLEIEDASIKRLLKKKSGVVGYLIQQGLLTEKKEKDVIGIKNSEELSKMSSMFEEDFLIFEDDDDDMGIDLDDNLELIDVPSARDYNFMNFYDLENDFLIRPNATKKTIRQNYILAKLKSLPLFEFEFNRNIILKTTDSKKMNLYELLNTLKKQFYNLIELKDENIWYELYELLCNTYIKLHARKTVHQYHLKGKKIFFSTTFKFTGLGSKHKQYVEKIKKRMKEKKEIRGLKITDDYISFDVVYNVKEAMMNFNKNENTKMRNMRKEEFIIHTSIKEVDELDDFLDNLF